MKDKINKQDIRWSVSEAIEEAMKINIPMTRPTVIRICEEKGAGYQPTGPHGNWLVVPDLFMAIIKGELV